MADLSDDKVYKKLKEMSDLPDFADTNNYEMAYDLLVRSMSSIIEQYEGVISKIKDSDPSGAQAIKTVLESIKSGLDYVDQQYIK